MLFFFKHYFKVAILLLLLIPTAAMSENYQVYQLDFPVRISSQQLTTQLVQDFLRKDHYDTKIQKEVNTYLPLIDWRIVKGQFYQESKLKPNVESHVGAKGIAQFMPETWEEVINDLNLSQNLKRTNPGVSIQLGAYYNSKLWRFWSSERPHFHKVAYMLGSYNAGAGSLLNAQKLCQQKTETLNCNLYQPTIQQLEHITGKHHKETIHYVENIFHFYFIELVH